MDSSNCRANYKLYAIRDAIADGSLTKAEIHRRLNYALHQERTKKPEERDMGFVTACETILYEMHTGHSFVSKKEESKQALLSRLNHGSLRQTTSSKIIKRVLLMAGALVIIAIGTEVLMYRQRLEGEQSNDEQQYIISGQEVESGLVDKGVADNAKQINTLSTTDLAEASAMLGYAPLVPTWVPDGWTVESYYVRIASAITFRIQYHNNQDEGLLRFGITAYPDVERAIREFEQAKSGTETLCNGWTVYVSQNVERTVAVWQYETTCYSLSGPITPDDMTRIIKSIKRSD